MAENYTKMWDAFLGGEWAGGGEATEGNYAQQTEDFYTNVIGEAFGFQDFGTSDLEGRRAAFSNVDFERAEQIFRSEIGDPYGGGAGDPFSWEKVSRYNTEDPSGVGRLQDLLEDQLYGQGKFLGGEAGADYGIATSKGVEEYSTGMRGESEALTYGALTSGVSLASGTSGATIRSGEGAEVAEDVLIEAYKKAKTLGSDYRAGKEGIERDLEKDLNTALTTYLAAIDDEKSDWFDAVMGDVNIYQGLMDDDTGAAMLTSADLSDKLGGDYYNDWSCGYGQEWDSTLNEGAGGCINTTGPEGYEDEVKGYEFRESAACGIGEIWQVLDPDTGDGECVVREGLNLELDDYGLLCAEMTECPDGSMVCDASKCPAEQEDQGCQGDRDCPEGTRCDNGTCVELRDECHEGRDECGVCGGEGPQQTCPDGTPICDARDCHDIWDRPEREFS